MEKSNCGKCRNMYITICEQCKKAQEQEKEESENVNYCKTARS